MWQLNPEQVVALARLQRERDLQRLGQTLGQAFPAAVERVGDRLGDLIALGVQRGQTHGLTHMLALARYLACWFALGAEFEAKPAFGWARTVLTRPDRAQGAKVYQLCRRTQDELARLARQTTGTPGVVTAAGFAQALASLDAELQSSGDLGSLLRGQSIRLGHACDIDGVDLRLEVAGLVACYRMEQGQWRRLPGTSSHAPITLKGGTDLDPGMPAAASPATGLPEALHLIGAGEAGGVAHLHLRLQASTVCDVAVHPLVSLNSPQAQREWRGDAARDLRLGLYAEPAAAGPADALQPVIAAEGAPIDSLLELGACGLRDTGHSLGILSTRLAVYPGHQHLMVWRRDAGPPLAWPETGAEPAPPASRVRIERDGVALDASRWQQGLESLDRQLMAGLRRLAAAWERTSGVTEGRVQAEPRLLAGTAALTWGWAENPKGMVSPPCYRVAGQLDLMACQLDLRFSGNLAWQGSSSKLSLSCAASEPLKAVFERSAADADILAVLQAAQCSFRQPLVLALSVVAQPEAAVLGVAGPVGGALVGSCGLRPRADGAGLQWFATLAVEPVSVLLHWHDPLLGQQQFVQPLLPAIPLVDWSLG